MRKFGRTVRILMAMGARGGAGVDGWFVCGICGCIVEGEDGEVLVLGGCDGLMDAWMDRLDWID